MLFRSQLFKKVSFPIDGNKNPILDEAWAVKIVDELNNTSYSEEAIAMADSLSLTNQIVTQNTALLALEPGIVVEPCTTCPDWNTGIPFWRWIGPTTGGIMFDNVKLATTNTVLGAPSSTTTTPPTTTGVDYFDIGYQAGLAEGEAKKQPLVTNAYSDGYALGIKEGNTKCGISIDSVYTEAYNLGLSEGKQIQVVGVSIFGNDDIIVYPNPFVDALTIKIAGSSVVTVELFDITGKKIITVTVTKTTTLNASNSVLGTLPSGVYLLKTTINGITKAVSIVKQ